MPYQNRVHPDGTLHAVPVRGGFMGNRGGRMHNPDGSIRRHHVSRRWICCQLRFGDRKRVVMGDGYTHLFFLDEAVALAAGHRPCFECRRQEALAFAEAWSRAIGPKRRADDMDRILHKVRKTGPHQSEAATVPDGAIIRTRNILLLWKDAAYPWRWDGYGPAQKRPEGRVSFLTPPPVCDVLSEGYLPQLALSAA